jgi:hypothetical protein
MTTNYQKIYEQLGNLFFAIAMADNHLKHKEVEKLKELVNKEWVPLEHSTDEFGTDAAYYIYISFDYLTDSFTTAEEAFYTFKVYYEIHKAVFSEKLKAKILTTATDIAVSFRGISKAEHEYLDRLEHLFEVKASQLK